jgi:signal transduction histidine kinase
MQDLANLNQIAEQILTLIANSQDSSALLNALALSIGKSFQVDACIAISACKHFPQNLAIGWWSESSFPVVDERVLQKSCFELLNQATKQQFSLKENEFPPIFTGHKSSLTANFQGKVDGALVLLQQEANSWSSSQKQQLEAISDVIAIAFDRVQLQQRVQTQASYQHLLNRLSAAISESSDLKILFNLALSEIGKALKIDRAEILTVKYRDPFFIQRKRQQIIKATLTVAESWSEREKNVVLPEKFSFELSNSQWCQKALEQAPLPLVVNEGANFPDLDLKFLPDKVKLPQSSALLMIPLMGKTSSEAQPALVLGFLTLQRDRLYTWNDEEINLINWISVQLSTALIHHQTLNQVQSIVEERTSQLKWSLDVQAKLSEKMRQQIEQLKKLNELKDDFLSSMSHELKTPMTSMKMAISMLRQNIPDAMREKYLNILEQEWHREYNLIKDLLTLQQVESGELTFNPKELNLNQIVENLSVSFTEKWHSLKGLTLKTTLSDSNLHFYADFDSLHHILSELLLNAGKYSDADTVISLAATTRHTLKGKEVEITINNYGTGIEADELPYIFDKFRRGKGVTDRAVAGTGLGLTLVKHLVEHLNGKIDVTSEAVTNSELYQTTFTVVLPQYK